MENTILKVIIVDDEELARKMLITGTDWNAMNMEIIAEAVSGQDALSIMEEQIPDMPNEPEDNFEDYIPENEIWGGGEFGIQ